MLEEVADLRLAYTRGDFLKLSRKFGLVVTYEDAAATQGSSAADSTASEMAFWPGLLKAGKWILGAVKKGVRALKSVGVSPANIVRRGVRKAEEAGYMGDEDDACPR